MSIIAFFDLDYTLLNTSSGITYLRESLKQRRIPIYIIGQVGLNYQLKQMDFGQAHARLIKYIGRNGYAEAKSFFNEWVPRRLFSRLSPVGRAKIDWHKKQGHRVVIISASIEEIVQPIAAHLGLGQDYLCTHLAVQDDQYTGELNGPLCYGTGKIHWAKVWAEQNTLNFLESVGYFYTDSASDLPLLELAKHPIAVNPSRRLTKIAKARNWQIEKFY